MKPICLLTSQPFAAGNAAPTLAATLPQLISAGLPPGETIRHILLGSPGAVRQTIHLLHTLHYTETVLWSPIVTVEEPLIITPARGEAISLLRKQI